MRYIGVTRTIHDRIAGYDAAPRLVFDNNARNTRAVLYDSSPQRTVQYFYPELQQQLLDAQREEVRIKLCDEPGFFPLLERPALKPGFRIICFRAVLNGKSQKLLADAEGHLITHSVIEREIDRDQTKCRHSPETVLPFQQNDVRSAARRGDRRRYTGNTSARYHYARAAGHFEPPSRLRYKLFYFAHLFDSC